MECKYTKSGGNYVGYLNVTRSGKKCQRWDSDKPHHNNYKFWRLFPDQSLTAAGNKCRSPDVNYNKGVWCYTTDSNTVWEQCDVDLCGS